MVALLSMSAFFSASEAALFSLRAPDRVLLRAGGRAQRLADRLLEDPDRLLSAVLLWNLVVNIGYFALASQVGLRLREVPRVGNSLFAFFTSGALLVMIFCSEMLPKSLAVLTARTLAGLVSLPLSLAVRLTDPLLPTLRVVTLLSRRLIWPTFRTEAYLQVTDLARAIELSSDDAQLIGHEQKVLRNLVSLSDLRVDECMRPRSQLPLYRAPVHWREHEQDLKKLDYVFVMEEDSDEIVGTLDLREFWQAPGDHLDRLAQKALYAPWSAKVADVLQQMQSRERHAIVVVNEHGESIGAITRSDILDIIFTPRSSRSERLLNRAPLQWIAENLWQATGMSNLRVLAEQFQTELPETGSVTIAGVLQESLQRLPLPGDHVEWGPFAFEVMEAEEQQPIVVHVKQRVVPESER